MAPISPNIRWGSLDSTCQPRFLHLGQGSPAGDSSSRTLASNSAFSSSTRKTAAFKSRRLSYNLLMFSLRVESFELLACSRGESSAFSAFARTCAAADTLLSAIVHGYTQH